MTLHSGRAYKGSQLHLQNLVNRQPERLNDLILSSSQSIASFSKHPIHWVSPIEPDYVEYQDREFLEILGLYRLRKKLSEFWPRRGPVWDALALLEGEAEKGVLLLEAKSHFGETGIPSNACRASGKSREEIERSLKAVKQGLGVDLDADWIGQYYQYANRLAHLYFLNMIGNVPTWLVILYFVGDIQQNGPLNSKEWLPKIREVESSLGLPSEHFFASKIVNVFVSI